MRIIMRTTLARIADEMGRVVDPKDVPTRLQIGRHAFLDIP